MKIHNENQIFQIIIILNKIRYHRQIIRNMQQMIIYQILHKDIIMKQTILQMLIKKLVNTYHPNIKLMNNIYNNFKMTSNDNTS
jgi:hypothetical protein